MRATDAADGGGDGGGDAHLEPTPTGQVRLIATDLDGTLLGFDEHVSPRNRAAIAAAHERGIRVVAATGRGWRSTHEVLDGVGIDIAVCSNGAEIYDLARRSSLHRFVIDADLVPDVLGVLEQVAPERGIAWEHPEGFGLDRAYDAMFPYVRQHYEVPVRDAPDPGVDVLKFLVGHPTVPVDELLVALRAVLPEGITSATSGGSLVELTGAEVHKAAALGVLCAEWAIHPADVVALGDNGNDVQMLAWAGRGIAMANAVPEAVAVADERTGFHHEDGFADVVEAIVGSAR